MLNLDDRTWEPFFIGDIFTVKRPKSRSEKDYKDGKSPFIASGNFNNGVIRCCEPHADETLDKGNCITVSPVDGSAFYQQSDFLGRGGAGSSVLLLYCEHINKYSGLFLARLIRQTCSKYCYGKMGNQDGIKREKILLPITDDGQPDYAFMEQYIREREDKLKQKYRDFVNAQLETPPIPLAEKTWKAFFISDICDIESGRDIYDAERVEGDIPYITSTAANNGIKYYVSNTNETLEENAISVNRNGSVGYSFYHKYKALYSNDCRKLKLKQCRNEFVALFITNQITQQKDKYNYGYKMGTGRLKRQRIMLPITDDGQPDYAFMEQYIKAVMFGKYKKYLEYAHSRVL